LNRRRSLLDSRHSSCIGAGGVLVDCEKAADEDVNKAGVEEYPKMNIPPEAKDIGSIQPDERACEDVVSATWEVYGLERGHSIGLLEGAVA
jgi:hypothetical protein